MRRASSPSTVVRFSVGGIGEVSRHDGDADLGLEQFDQVALGGDFVAALDVRARARATKRSADRVFAIVPRQQLLGSADLKTSILSRLGQADDAC